MDLILKFFIKDKKQTRLVMSPAIINEWGLYKDARYVYTQEGKFDKRLIFGEITEIWTGEDESEDTTLTSMQ